jgi:hypothetical protein
MRLLLYLLSFALMLPGLLLASGFIVLGHAIAGGTLGRILHAPLVGTRVVGRLGDSCRAGVSSLPF